MASKNQTLSGTYFGRCWEAEYLKANRGNKGFDLRRGGSPVPWSDGYAIKLLQGGRSFERVRFVERLVEHPDYEGETVVRREVVDTFEP